MTIALGLAAQYVVIAIAVIASAGYLVQRQWPQAVRQARVAIAVGLLRAGRPALARWIAPPSSEVAAACGGCNGCGSAARR
ncbi:DUF6587 family protein [Lysobacter korlensis]|uniref:DUF6587 family protein n=1 Tax=Lysobacter korlensis TaxID=553636 RepID=A0ABV6RMV0_9GAMM